MGKSEIGLYGVIEGMTLIVMVAYTMRLLRVGIAAEDIGDGGWTNGRYIFFA